MAGRSVIATTTVENGLTFSYKCKHQSLYFTPRFLPKRNGHPQKDLYRIAPSSFMHHSPKLETTWRAKNHQRVDLKAPVTRERLIRQISLVGGAEALCFKDSRIPSGAAYRSAHTSETLFPGSPWTPRLALPSSISTLVVTTLGHPC